ncbi:MAG: ThuA domain-containing protein [Verrucomicrobiota bacterium]|nr:ThuA domain-containing protein [Verrucomicrobiota bacterium]
MNTYLPLARTSHHLFSRISMLLCVLVSCIQAFSAASGPIRALMIAGGCCHDYPNQNLILSEGISSRAHVEWTLVNQGGTSRDIKIPFYDNPDWAKGYDVVVHNECFGGVKDVTWLESIVATHTRQGIPAVFVHCSLHSYRAAKTDAWRSLMGARSTSHEGHRPLDVENLRPNHPVMKTFPPVWHTPNGELYKIEKMWPDAIPLAKAFGKDTQKDHVCVWLNHLGDARVFTTTLGHHNETMESPIYLDMVSRGLLWTVGRLDADGSPSEGYDPPEQTALRKRRILGGDYTRKRIAIVDEWGQVEWEYPIQDIHDLHVLPNGNILFQTGWTSLLEMTPNKEIIWSYDAASMNGNQGRRVEVHAFQRLPNGLTMIAESGPARIIEVDRDGVIHRSIGLQVDHPNPHRDTRMARKLDNGHYLVCHEADQAVREYDRQGKVVWEFVTGGEVYGAMRLKNGNTLIGNGGGHNVLEVDVKGKVVWSIEEDELPGVKLAWVTTVEELPNGNYMIGNCHAGPDNPQIIEVTKDKQVVWSFNNFEVFGNAMPCSKVF